jgi:hypothetical protein
MTATTLRRLVAASGLLGPIALAVYFAAPWLVNWPMGNVTNEQLATFASHNRGMFFLGAWFQGVGSLLSVVFFVGIVHLAGATSRLAGLIAVAAAAVLLGLSLVEGAFLVTVPLAVASGHAATAQTSFDLSTISFVHVFPIVPVPAVLFALGAVILGSKLLPRSVGVAALAIGAAFEIVGFAALFNDAFVIPIIGLLVVDELWIVAAALSLLRVSGEGRLTGLEAARAI